MNEENEMAGNKPSDVKSPKAENEAFDAFENDIKAEKEQKAKAKESWKKRADAQVENLAGSLRETQSPTPTFQETWEQNRQRMDAEQLAEELLNNPHRHKPQSSSGAVPQNQQDNEVLDASFSVPGGPGVAAVSSENNGFGPAPIAPSSAEMDKMFSTEEASLRAAQPDPFDLNFGTTDPFAAAAAVPEQPAPVASLFTNQAKTEILNALKQLHAAFSSKGDATTNPIHDLLAKSIQELDSSFGGAQVSASPDVVSDDGGVTTEQELESDEGAAAAPDASAKTSNYQDLLKHTNEVITYLLDRYQDSMPKTLKSGLEAIQVKVSESISSVATQGQHKGQVQGMRKATEKEDLLKTQEARHNPK